jgi:hypothetical protein
MRMPQPHFWHDGDPNEHPGVVKSDCVVLDFGTSTILHGSLEQDVNLDGHEGHGEAPQKECLIAHHE